MFQASSGGAVANPAYDWTFYTEDQPCVNGRKMRLPQGKGLGGSSQINFLGIVRPSKEEYDAIEELGNKGWNWHSLLEATKRSEHTVPSEHTPEQAQELAIRPDPHSMGKMDPSLSRFRRLKAPFMPSFSMHWNICMSRGTLSPVEASLSTRHSFTTPWIHEQQRDRMQQQGITNPMRNGRIFWS